MRRALAAVFALAGLATGPAAAQRLRLVPLDVRVPLAPTPVRSLGQAHLAYELRITNLGRSELSIDAIAVEDPAGRTLARWEGDSLRSMMTFTGPPGADPRVIGPGRQALAYVWVATGETVPVELRHRLVATPRDTAGVRDSVVGIPVAPRRDPPPVVGSPFGSPGLWLTGNGPGNVSGHRRTAIPVDGLTRIPQRFATDWVKFGADGRLFRGDSTRNESWYGYGEELVAIAPGTVVATKDGIPDNVPLSPERAVPITMETVGGNFVIVDIGGGLYAFYAHLQAGSLRVRVGDRVRRGQPLGLLGNSGNSDAPHLHLHLGDRPSPLGTEGLPFVFEEYVRLGRVPGFLAPLPDGWQRPEAGETRRRELPLDNDVIRFR